MALYARPSARLVRQIGTDLFVVLWGLCWWFAGGAADAMIRALAEPAKATEGAARQMQDGFAEAAKAAAGIPWAGPSLRQPFDAAASGLGQIVGSAQDQVASIEAVATMTGWLTFGIPVSVVLAFWLPQRIRFVLNSAAAARFIDAQPDLELLALRALATQPFHRLARISDDPLAAWKDGDGSVINALAELELRRGGWVRPSAPKPALPPPPPERTG